MTTSVIPFPEDYFLVLQSCLDCLQDGDQTIDSVLLLYPRLGDQLRPPLEAAAWLYSKKGLLNPRPEFIPASRNHLVTCLQMWDRTPVKIRRTRGRKTRIVIGKNALFFSLIGTVLAGWLK
jgi:hypothetical protein